MSVAQRLADPPSLLWTICLQQPVQTWTLLRYILTHAPMSACLSLDSPVWLHACVCLPVKVV